MQTAPNMRGTLAAGDATSSLRRVRELDGQGRFDQALEMLRRLAQGGDAAAMTRLGRRLLVGHNAPFEPQEAIRLLAMATERNDADAAAQMATLAAAGAWMPQNWSAALDFLQQGAELGSPGAQGQLLLLGGEGPENTAQQARSWKALRESVDVAAWMSPPATRQPLCESPRIRLARDFASPQTCKWLIGLGRGKVRPAMMYDGKSSRFTAQRTNSDYFFDVVGADVVVALIRQRISALLKMPTFAMESPQMLHYACGQELRAHYDHVGGESGCQSERIATFLLYLNDDYEGGELEFPKVGLRARGNTGDCIYFSNVDLSGQRDMLTLHSGLAVTRGEKWLFSQWIHDRAFTGMN